MPAKTVKRESPYLRVGTTIYKRVRQPLSSGRSVETLIPWNVETLRQDYGKSYLACALGHEACKRGFRTLYANATKLLGALKVAKVKGTLETELKKIERCQLLILDDLFIVPLDAKERPILLEIIEDRHERKSIIITSQYPSSNWYDMVGDPTIADAILDRIIHTAHTIELYGESMRKLRSKKNEKF